MPVSDLLRECNGARDGQGREQAEGLSSHVATPCRTGGRSLVHKHRASGEPAGEPFSAVSTGIGKVFPYGSAETPVLSVHEEEVQARPRPSRRSLGGGRRRVFRRDRTGRPRPSGRPSNHPGRCACSAPDRTPRPRSRRAASLRPSRRARRTARASAARRRKTSSRSRGSVMKVAARCRSRRSIDARRARMVRSGLPAGFARDDDITRLRQSTTGCPPSILRTANERHHGRTAAVRDHVQRGRARREHHHRPRRVTGTPFESIGRCWRICRPDGSSLSRCSPCALARPSAVRRERSGCSTVMALYSAASLL